VLGLLRPTDPTWAERASDEVERVLVDHANCEMKAASNALALSARCSSEPKVVRALVALAEEELGHFREVLDELERRGLRLGPPEEDWYAAELRRRVSKDRGSPLLEDVIVDRMLVGALIEARSCERFKLLAAALRERDPELAGFYERLLAAEARHHRTFVDLAILLARDEDRVRRRLAEIVRIEDAIAAELGVAPTIHG
jgi:tRNA-(ms[2]io[6]A)-hydroxylase